MLSNGYINCEFDSGNRLISAGDHTYTYNAEDVRIRNLCADADTTYTYNTNCKLSQLLCKTTNGITTKYVYGLGLIGEEKCGEFKTYHFDFRGSTVAITDTCGNITDTFEYDTYGKMTQHCGNSFVIFGYNGRDGVITDRNGLLYMRARYYSPNMRRFINADIIPGEIFNAITLNRYAYANGNPVSNTDPFGLAAEERGNTSENSIKNIIKQIKEWFSQTFGVASTVGSEYDVFSLSNLFGDIETGFSLNKEYKGKYKPIEFVSESSGKDNILDSKIGIKVNFNEESGLKIAFGLGKLSIESANKNSFFEFIVESNKVGITVSNEVDWKNYSVGRYTSYYIRPLSIAATAAIAVGAVAAIYYTGGAAAGVFASVIPALVGAG